jgi:hypothetical protein
VTAQVFAADIGIEDDMSVMVRYQSGATMTYHLVSLVAPRHTSELMSLPKTAYSPWEGYRVMFNGSQGRLELEVVESEFRLPSDEGGVTHGVSALPHAGGARVTLQRLWEKPQDLPIVIDHSAHGGGDVRMLSKLFGPLPGETREMSDASKQGATERDGALALAVGVMANESFRTGEFVHLKDLRFPL